MADGSEKFNVEDEFDEGELDNYSDEQLEQIGVERPEKAEEKSEDVGASEDEPKEDSEEDGGEPEEAEDDKGEPGDGEEPDEAQIETDSLEKDESGVQPQKSPPVDIPGLVMSTVVGLPPNHPDYEAFSKYNGMTIKEIFDENPGDGQLIYDKQKAYVEFERDEQARIATEAVQRQERQYTDYTVNYAKKYLGRDIKSIADIKDSELNEFIAYSKQLDAYAKRNGLTTPVKDATGKLVDTPIVSPLHLMKLFEHDKAEQSAQEDDAILKQTRQKRSNVTRSVDGNKGEGKPGGYEACRGMSRSQLNDYLSKMSDVEEMSFLTKAPDWFRKEFADIIID